VTVKRKQLYIMSALAGLAILVLVLLYTCNLFPFSSGAAIQDGETGIVSKDGMENIEKTEPEKETVRQPAVEPPKTKEQKDTAPPAKVEKKDTVISTDQFTLLMEYEGHKYYISKNVSTWRQAYLICQKYGGHLVTITSDAENKVIIEALKTKKISESIWIGFTDQKKEGQWEWVTGEKSAFTYWDQGQPDNSGGNNEQFARIFSSNYSWHDFLDSYDRPAYFILEKE
jgi:hypothetical protein